MNVTKSVSAEDLKLGNITRTCCLCGAELTNTAESYAAVPLLEGESCQECYESMVIPQREAYEDAMDEYEAEEEAQYEADEFAALNFELGLNVKEVA